MSKAVGYAHQERMMHRDSELANIMQDKRNTAPQPIGEPVLTDFGDKYRSNHPKQVKRCVDKLDW